MQREQLMWIGLGVMAVGLLAMVFFLVRGSDRGRHAAARPRRFGRRRPHRDEFRPEGTTVTAPTKRAAVVLNPSKFSDVDEVERTLANACLEAGWAEPLVLHTTVEDPGTGQAREAVEQGVNLVCALGGDGTVRAVAEAVAGTETPMALLPGGTGNLLARNLDLPYQSLDDSLEVALTGQNKRIDVGRLVVQPDRDIDDAAQPDDPEAPTEEHLFLVMAGFGFDAAIMADAPEDLKAKVGPAAYVVSGAKHLRGPQFKVKVKVGDEPEFTRRTRTVVVGNCGRLVGGLVLMPDAQLDDGQLDTVIISPRGVAAWGAVAARLISRSRKGHSIVDHYTSPELRVSTDKSQDVQIDGDVIGRARSLHARVDPLALTVRVPTPQA